MIDNNSKLLVFEEFTADTTLPKFQKGKLREGEEYGEGQYSVIPGESMMMSNPWNPRFDFDGGFRDPADVNIAQGFTVKLKPYVKPKGFLAKLAFWNKTKTKVEEDNGVSIAEFFSSIKNSAKELSIIADRAKGYEQAMARARSTGQAALFEQLSGGLNAQKMEAQLIALGLNKYLEEDDIVKFYKQSKKGLRLSWVRNFARTIPDDIVAKKVHADELEIFDNYVVLHYDPNNKSYAETQAEKDARKDPILFGIMRNRRKLYFIGDWIDELCDLTLDQIADVLGKEVIKNEGGTAE